MRECLVQCGTVWHTCTPAPQLPESSSFSFLPSPGALRPHPHLFHPYVLSSVPVRSALGRTILSVGQTKASAASHPSPVPLPADHEGMVVCTVSLQSLRPPGVWYCVTLSVLLLLLFVRVFASMRFCAKRRHWVPRSWSYGRIGHYMGAGNQT